MLEAGTGTGYNAALLSVLAGEAKVTTIETDPDVMARARNALRYAGFAPSVVSGDASLGYPPRAPCDRVIGTYTVQTIPYGWVEQYSPGAVILTPWGNAFDSSGLLRLHVDDDDDDGTATGRCVGDDVGFMWDRGQVSPFAHNRDLALDEHEPDVSTTKLWPGSIIGDAHVLFAIGLRLPDCRQTTVFAPDDTGRSPRGRSHWIVRRGRACPLSQTRSSGRLS